MRHLAAARLLVGAFLAAACGDDGPAPAGAGGSGATSGTTATTGSGLTPCGGTHLPCSYYAGVPQACLDHGCSVNNAECVGEPHACEDEAPHDCGKGHGCDACAACGPGTVCVQRCLLGGVNSPNVECVENALTCDACNEECSQAFCDYGAIACMEQCFAPAPGSFSCIKQLDQ